MLTPGPPLTVFVALGRSLRLSGSCGLHVFVSLSLSLSVSPWLFSSLPVSQDWQLGVTNSQAFIG